MLRNVGRLGIIITAIATWAYALGVVLRYPKTRLPPNRVAWFDAQGSRLPESIWRDGDSWRGCTGSTLLTSVRDGRRLITVCRSNVESRLQSGGLAAIDVEERRARILWPFPRELPMHEAEAVVPKDGAFAFVYTALSIGSVVGVAGRDGWLTPPVAIGRERNILGVEWVNDVVEIAISRRTGDGVADTPAIVRVGADGALTVRELAPGVMCPDVPCDQWIAAYRREGAWRFLAIPPYVPGEVRRVFDVGEAGGQALVALPPELKYPTQIIPQGRVALTTGTELLSDGRVVMTSTPPGPQGADVYPTNHRSIDDGHLRVVHHWVKNHDKQHDYEDERTTIGPDGIRLTIAAKGESVALLDPPRGVLAKRGSCTGLSWGEFLPRTGGGRWLVSDEGCYVELTADWERVHAPSVFNHVLRGRTGDFGVKDRLSGLALGWLAFGLPVLLGAATIVGLRQRRRRWVIPASAAFWTVVAIGAWTRLLPLFQ